MKKIMFNDKFGLTKAVLEGRKTQTRRMMLDMTAIIMQGRKNSLILSHHSKEEIVKDLSEFGNNYSPYKVGNVIAIAQSYKDCAKSGMQDTPGWTNKMFVRADLMPHHIAIDRVRVERLQDISEEDCLKEGICYIENPPASFKGFNYRIWPVGVKPYKRSYNNIMFFASARYAYARLIDMISGKGTWDKNPFVFVYDFSLID